MTVSIVPNHQASTGFLSKPPSFRNLHIQGYSHWFLRHIPGSPKNSLTTVFFSLMEAPEWAGFTDIVDDPLGMRRYYLLNADTLYL